jgi:hypothetical protein
MDADISNLHNRIVMALSLAKTIGDAFHHGREADGAVHVLIAYLTDTCDMAEKLENAERNRGAVERRSLISVGMRCGPSHGHQARAKGGR